MRAPDTLWPGNYDGRGSGIVRAVDKPQGLGY
jgi:hypothetical protein